MPIPRLALTPGEPAGIGPDICLMLANEALTAEIVVIASPELLEARARQLGMPINLVEFDSTQPPSISQKGTLKIVPISLKSTCIAGTLNVANSRYVLDTLDLAFEMCANGQANAMVTGPVHKAIIYQSGVAFTGHTEYLRDLASVKDVLMTFHTPEFILGTVTTHTPLHKVSEELTKNRLNSAIQLLHQGLTRFFGKERPCIHVLGLNPHAGEEGTIGKEEQDLIAPLIEQWQKQGYNIQGPMSGDTAFIANNRFGADAILAMYHDQGLAPIKALFFGKIVNVTFGLPFLRTSVDHGTALHLAGSGLAQHQSLLHAVDLAATQVIQK
jgi:4-hydroxythreonine-4-phosphate dehydrogenase